MSKQIKITKVQNHIFPTELIELLSWCGRVLDRLDKLARDGFLAIGNNKLVIDNLTSQCSLTKWISGKVESTGCI